MRTHEVLEFQKAAAGQTEALMFLAPEAAASGADQTPSGLHLHIGALWQPWHPARAAVAGVCWSLNTSKRGLFGFFNLSGSCRLICAAVVVGRCSIVVVASAVLNPTWMRVFTNQLLCSLLLHAHADSRCSLSVCSRLRWGLKPSRALWPQTHSSAAC